MKILRCWTGSNPIGGKHFAEINLPFTMKQYKNDNIANFVQLRENSNNADQQVLCPVRVFMHTNKVIHKVFCEICVTIFLV